MTVPVMDVRKMRVAVHHRLMVMKVAVRLARWIIGIVHMLVVLIVHVQMFVLHSLVLVFVRMPFGEV